MILKRKAAIEFKMAEGEGNGRMEGYANVFGVIDSYGDVTRPGTFLQDIGEFIAGGFLAVDHEWAIKSIIGYIVSAHEDEKGLYFVAEFHGDDESQAVRRKIAERIAAGKTVELSIGYWALEEEPGEWQGQRVNFLNRVKVREVSPVMAAANPASTVSAAKSRAEEGEDLASLAERYLARVEEIRELGRSDEWLKARAHELRDLGARYLSLADAMDAGKEPEPADEAPDHSESDALAALALVEAALSAQ